MTMRWSTRFKIGDTVEWVGPEDSDDSDIPPPGHRGTVISIDPPDQWVVQWAPGFTAVYSERLLRKVES
jgi:hypothetical protein